jgi:hypothetical protein
VHAARAASASSPASRALSYAIILGSFGFKIPEILKLLKTKSDQGRSTFSSVCDVLAVLMALAYNFAQPGQASGACDRACSCALAA